MRKLVLRRICNAVCAFSFVVLCATAAKAQAYVDQVTVDLPYSVTLADKTLQPGQYMIRQVSDRVLQIIKDPKDPKSMTVEAAVITIPTEDNAPSKQTSVILNKIDNDYYFNKLWLQGKSYGYEFTMPERLKERLREQGKMPVIAAKYEQVPGAAANTSGGEKK